jgi:hypothetical protein
MHPGLARYQSAAGIDSSLGVSGELPCLAHGEVRLKVSMSPSLVRLQMVALAPFVPRIYEDEVLIGIAWIELGDGLYEPLAIGIGGRVDEYRRVNGAPR